MVWHRFLSGAIRELAEALNPYPALTAHFSAIKALGAEKDTVNLKIASFELNSTSVRVRASLKKTKTIKTNEMKNVSMLTVGRRHKFHMDNAQALKGEVAIAQYILNQADKPKYRACSMIDIKKGEEFFCPRLGSFVFSSFGDERCRCSTSSEAVEVAERILKAMQEEFSQSSSNDHE
jgi:hypothetical protein